MNELYASATPNGFKFRILLAKLALPYRARRIALSAGDKLEPNFLAT